jgi:hypothetical protein
MNTVIGTRNERSLHAALKAWYARPGDDIEAEIDGSVVDIRRGKLVIEIQTGNFGSMRHKLERLLQTHRVLLVYPVATHKVITTVDPLDTSIIVKQRRSPKTGSVIDLFRELVYLCDIVPSPGFSIEVVFTEVEEIRCADGKGSWRRGGVSILDRKLSGVNECRRLTYPSSYNELLPVSLEESFTSADLASALHARRAAASKCIYCCHRMGILEKCGKRGRSILYRRLIPVHT